MSRIEMAMEMAAKLRDEALEPLVEEPKEQSLRVAVRAAIPVVPPEKVLSPKNPFLVSLVEPHAAAAEEYRKLKSALVKMTAGEAFSNTVMITSAVPNEGKTLTSLNLAISLAQGLDHTVLLIDADLRRPSLHRYLEIEPGRGLADILKGEAEIGETIVPTGIGKLSVITAGTEAENPVELFSSQKMRGLVEELKYRYPDRYVIFDTPPLLPFAESRSLAHTVDGVLLVVMERLASQGAIQEALEAMKGTRLLGTVYNAASITSNEERYSYYNRYRGRN